jgi:hypothetical protein
MELPLCRGKPNAQPYRKLNLPNPYDIKVEGYSNNGNVKLFDYRIMAHENAGKRFTINAKQQ